MGTCEACGIAITEQRKVRNTMSPKRFCSEQCRRRGEYQRRKQRQAHTPIVVADPIASGLDGWPVSPAQPRRRT